MKIKVDFRGKKQVTAHFGNFDITTDQPVAAGGEELAPTPFELFLSSLVTCAGIFVREFCIGRSLPTENVYLEQEMEFNKEIKKISKIAIHIFIPQDFPEKYDTAIINSASLCLVKRHLTPDIHFDIDIVRH
jgi:ribosomal protein S12 methylthiotransferase accessory factor